MWSIIKYYKRSYRISGISCDNRTFHLKEKEYSLVGNAAQCFKAAFSQFFNDPSAWLTMHGRHSKKVLITILSRYVFLIQSRLNMTMDQSQPEPGIPEFIQSVSVSSSEILLLMDCRASPRYSAWFSSNESSSTCWQDTGWEATWAPWNALPCLHPIPMPVSIAVETSVISSSTIEPEFQARNNCWLTIEGTLRMTPCFQAGKCLLTFQCAMLPIIRASSPIQNRYRNNWFYNLRNRWL